MSEESNVAIPHLYFAWNVAKRLISELCSLKLTGIKVLTLSTMGVTVIPHIARLPACLPFYPAFAAVFYLSWYCIFVESSYLFLRIANWHSLYFCCGGGGHCGH